MNDNQRRREYADLIEQRRKIEKSVRVANGVEPSLGTKTKRLAEAVVTGILLGELWDAMTED